MSQDNKLPTQAIQSPIIEQKSDLDLERERGSERYAAYVARFRQIKLSLLKLKRYLAYSSDIGESVRPVVNPKVVTFTYGVAWAYVLGDCGYLAYLDRQKGESQTVQIRTFISSFTFQAIASMALPAIIIHTAVAQTGKLCQKEHFKNKFSEKTLRILPSFIGLGIIPFLPLLDHPIEHFMEQAFDKYWPVERVNKNEKQH